MKTSLISFVGTNDKGEVIDGKKTEGAIITALQERKFNQLHLLWNPTKSGITDYYKIASHVEEIAVKKKYFKAEDISLHSFECKNVSDHNEIYPKLLEFCKSLPKGIEYTAAIASGTSAMQVCWILMAESGDFKIKLIRSNEPKYGKPLTKEVKLGTGLPKIQKLEKENRLYLKEAKKNLLPVEIDTKYAKVNIAGIDLRLSPIEFCYYLLFLKRVIDERAPIQVTVNKPSTSFIQTLTKYYSAIFPHMEIRSGENTSFHSNITKINGKIKKLIDNKVVSRYYTIQSDGPRGRKFYSINLDRSKIKLKLSANFPKVN